MPQSAFVEMLGGTVACVSCYDRHDKKAYTYSKKGGIDPRFLLSIVDEYGTIDKAKAQDSGYVIEDGDAWITKEANVLIPAALEGQVNADSVKKISKNIKIVAEGANGPCTPEADEVFKKNNIFVIPDFLCNAGGVTTSYFEQVQNDMNFYWTKEEVLEKLDHKDDLRFQRRCRTQREGKGLHARCGLHGCDRSRGESHGSARLVDG